MRTKYSLSLFVNVMSTTIFLQIRLRPRIKFVRFRQYTCYCCMASPFVDLSKYITAFTSVVLFVVVKAVKYLLHTM